MNISVEGLKAMLNSGVIIRHYNDISIHYEKIGDEVETSLYINGCYIRNNFKPFEKLNFNVFKNLKKISIKKHLQFDNIIIINVE